MRTTRSATRAAVHDAGTRASKRKSGPDTDTAPVIKKRKPVPKEPASASKAGTTPPTDPDAETTSTGGDIGLVPAVLTFSFEDAKRHLVNVDHRFEDLFDKMSCRPFQHPETVQPFRALVTSILGQQISWLAARSINHKFRRLYDPSLPEKPMDDHKSPTSPFPTPEQVAKTDLTTLKSAGLSTRKAEYVQDLASRFADGRLSTKKLIEADDEELARMLIEVRGIGSWTVDMFAIFSLRRPDILPVGDLGVQRGLVRWFLSLHSPAHSYSISPEKVGGSTKDTKGKLKKITTPEDKDVLPITGGQSTSTTSFLACPPAPDVSSVPPTTALDNSDPSDEIPIMPPLFTPSIRKTLHKAGVKLDSRALPLPDGLSVSILKSRLDGKKKIKGAFLTPKEMEDLTACWKPYRSIGVYYMWSLAEVSM